uniref:RHS repeat domain-containing protein n=1 Tax=Sedimentitalea todarodis TaxID=1631240 RepID=UPI003743BF20
MSYGYDELGRLVSSTNTAGPDTGYDYDPANNRLTFSVLGAAASGAALPAASETGAQSAPSPQNVSEPVCSPVSGCAGK